ncbi:SDR family oxidoreductase [Paraflavitalea sp. CAU 1676]|uniref:SDR family oxidoreductase n=1 Tax=Paraflavitalea sp. CAU 1676 TaxID=3032598 RepID=UPI0023D9F53E|nr:SDR family oxidoreductase [Paraflavitalea sp. CAU 1676]MDF2191275.1 SDR family oxidoreductase [Paraflavitalea sp. CAU 1676]
MSSSIQHKTIVVTGASSGVGKAIALQLATKGATLILAARREAALQETAAACMASGSKVLVVTVNMQNVEEIRVLAEKAYQFGGAIDVWINNAGVLAAGPLEEVPPEVSEAVIKTNLLGYMHSAHVVIPYFKKQTQGILINNISVGGWFPTPYATAYTASKFGLRGFSEALKGELIGWRDIHVCDLYPGFLDTPGMQHAANYTGKSLKPAPPVYNPWQVARAVVRVIENPVDTTTIGLGAALLRIAWNYLPVISRLATVLLIRSYLKQAPTLAATSGNVLGPVHYGTSVDGGWQLAPATKKKAMIWAAAGIVGVLAGLIINSKKAGAHR